MSEVATAKGELARGCGVHPRTVNRWMARPDWPFACGRGGRWDVGAVKRWRGAAFRERRAGGTDDYGRGVDREIQKLRLRRLQLETGRLEAGVVPRELHERCLDIVTKLLIEPFEHLPGAAAHELVGLTPGEVERVLRERIDDIRRRFVAQAGVT